MFHFAKASRNYPSEVRLRRTKEDGKIRFVRARSLVVKQRPFKPLTRVRFPAGPPASLLSPVES